MCPSFAYSDILSAVTQTQLISPQEFQRSSLELVLLAMVKLGVNTTYELMTKAGLSVGITSRSLRSLEAAELLTSTAGTRSSQRFAITKAGERELQLFWAWVARQDSPTTFEFAVRVLYLGWLSGDLTAASKYGARAIANLRRRAQKQAAEVADIRQRYPQLWRSEGTKEDQLSAAGLVSLHKLLKNAGDAEVAHAQANALEKAIAELEKLIPASRFVPAGIQEEMFGAQRNVPTVGKRKKL
jgi:DNA-binding PadR family transcriptional regulator